MTESLLGDDTPIRVPGEIKPQLVVVVDTEEEFTWSAPPDRNATSVLAMQHIDRVQTIFDDYGIVPCYVVDYPVVAQEKGTARLLEYHRAGRCQVGVHVHPWVNPPFSEELTAYNTYVGNLPRDLEREKILTLSQRIEEVFGKRPVAYKAGRYGIGPNTASILEELRFDIDLSYCPPVDYRGDGGPDYSRAHAQPFWFGSKRKLLEIPVTGAFVGWTGSMGKRVYEIATLFDKLRARGILSKIGAVDRLMLSPEGFYLHEHKKLASHLYSMGVRTFTWSFHSTSVVPGVTPYVANDNELELFLESFRRFFDYFFDTLGGEHTTPTKLKQKLERF